MNIPCFNTVFGRNLIGEVQCFAPRPFLVITMGDLWPIIRHHFDDEVSVYFVDSLEEEHLLQSAATLNRYLSFVGIGGGQAIDVAKYFSWRTDRTLFQLPTSSSVDAVFGHRCGVRRNAKVHYVGWAVPDTVFIDFDVIRAAPEAINLAGIGDVLCFHTGVLDWRYARDKGRLEAKWPYDETLAATSLARVEALLAHQHDVRELNDTGIRVLIEGHIWGGASYLGAGWNPRHIEGYDHFFFYALEYMTRQKFLHGQPVCLGTYVGACLHDARAGEILSAIARMGVDIRPEAMGVCWDQVGAVMKGLAEFVRANNLWYGIAHDACVDDATVARIRTAIEDTYGAWV